jgi:hypothetical protein
VTVLLEVVMTVVGVVEMVLDVVAIVTVAVEVALEEKSKRAEESDMGIDEQDIYVHVQASHIASSSCTAIAWSTPSQVARIQSPASSWKVMLVQMQARSVLKRGVSGKKR